jgi:hypothetical protein
MRPSRHRIVLLRKLFTAAALVCLLAGCSVVGPTALRSGRSAYNEAITDTNNQQLLKMVIYSRYGVRGNLLAVSSVTANVSVRTSSALQFGFGDTDNYSGNLVPFSAGSVYEENPTISYIPVAGEKYTRQLMSPVPINLLALFAGTLTDPASIYNALIANINGIHNPDFLFYPTEADPRFTRLVTILTALTQGQCLHWIEDPHDQRFSVVIDNDAPAYTVEVRELLDLLGLPAPKDSSPHLILPVSLALHGREQGGIGIITRSVFELGEILGAAIEVPADDVNNGVATNYPPPGLAGENLRIRYSRDKPEHAYISVKYRDGWFYIDESDQATKRFFRLMSALWSVTIAESTTNATAAPVLTVPVSR